jgi:hypothetical protein
MTDAPPDSAQRAAMLSRIMQYASDYLRKLPDFVCTQVARNSVDESGTGERWREREVVEEEVSYVAHRDSYKVLRINGKATTRPHEKLKFRTEGDFGGTLPTIFDPQRQAEFEWARWEAPGDRRRCVFSFRVPQSRSVTTVGRITVAIHGFVHADCETGTILGIREDMDPSSNLPWKSASYSADYGPVTISGQRFILPLKSEWRLVGWKRGYLRTIQYGQYRKFGADATVVFDAPK